MIAQLEMPIVNQPLTKYRQLAAEVRSHKDEVKVFTAKDWHPTPTADAMLVKLRLRRVAWFEPKPAPAHLRDDGTVPLWSSKYRRTKCECGRATYLDADGWSLWWNSDAAVCPDCYASEMDRMPSKKDTEGNSLIRDNSGCGTLAIDSYRVALQKRH